MKKKGKISSWNEDKGYGFIVPLDGGNRTFVHIKAFANRTRRPVVGDVITYSMSSDSRGRPCAGKAAIAGIVKTSKRTRSSGVLSNLTALILLLLVGGAVYLSLIPVPLILFYVVVSAITFSAYAFDKVAAKRGRWRTSENTLYLLSLVGGWPGALMAQSYLRHKTKKQPFRAIFWMTVVLNCAALVWLLTPQGEGAWRSMVGVLFRSL
ncbi:MAG: cold shock and DUF1294 domain-containing protein [Candidatus Thiodiazotropha sp. LLP2]